VKPQELVAALRTLWTKSQVPFDRENLGAFLGVEGKKLDRALTALVKAGALGVEADDGTMRWTMAAGPRPIEGPETLPRFRRLEKMRADAKAKVRARAKAKQSGQPLEDLGESTALATRPRRSREIATVDEGAWGKHRSSPNTNDEDDDEDEGGPSLLRASGRAAKGALSLVSGAAGKLDRKGTGGRKSLLASGALSFMGPLGWLYAGSFREAVPALAVFSLLAWIIPNPILWPLLWFALPVSALAGVAYAWQYNRSGERRSLFLSSPDEEDGDES